MMSFFLLSSAWLRASSTFTRRSRSSAALRLEMSRNTPSSNEAALLQINEGVGDLQVRRPPGTEGHLQIQLQVGRPIREPLLVNPGHFRQILPLGVAHGEVAPHQLLGGHARDRAKGPVDRQNHPVFVRQPHAVGGALPDGTKAGFRKTQFLLRLLPAVMSSTIPS